MTTETQRHSVGSLVSTSRYGVIAFAVLFGIGATVQVFLAGLSAFDTALYWEDHVFLGRMLGLPALLLPVLSLVGRLGRRTLVLSATVTALYIVQTGLTMVDIPTIAALHAVNAFPLIGIPIGVAMNTFGTVRETGSGAEATPSAS